MKSHRLLWLSLLAASAGMGAAHAAAPDEQWVRNAAKERTDFRAAVHGYYDAIETLCPAMEVPQHKTDYREVQGDFKLLVDSVRSGPLEFDVDVAMADAVRRWDMARSVVDCSSPSSTVTNYDIIQSQARINAAKQALATITEAAGTALEKAE